MAQYLGLTELETDYFLNLVEWERTTSKKLRNSLLRQRQALLELSKSLGSRLPRSRKLSEADQAIYYSHWHYSAIYLLTDLAEYQTPEALAAYLKLSQLEVRKAVDFLISIGLVEEKKDKLLSGPNWIHAKPESQDALRHHINWRLIALERLSKLGTPEIAFTLAYTLSKKDTETLRKMIEDFVSKMGKLVEASPPEKLMCLNIDFFEPK